MADEWRRVVGTLADPVRLRVYASVVLGHADGRLGDDASMLPAKKREKAVAALLAAGLIARTSDAADGVGAGESGPGREFVANEDAFAKLLAAAPAVTREGLDRFIRDGRIEQYPARPADRREVLVWARDRVITVDEVLSESEITERLASIAPDAVILRRYLVEARLVARDAEGRHYSSTTPG